MRICDIDYKNLSPKGWDTIKLRQAFSFGKGLSITKDDLVEEGIPVISYGQIHSRLNTGTGLNDTLIRYVPDSYLSSSPKCLMQKNDIVFADTSEDYTGVGNCAFIDSDTPIFAGYHSIIAHPILKSCYPKYYAYLFQTDYWRNQIRAQVMGTKVFSITQTLLRNTFVLVPPVSEQQAIAKYLDTVCPEIDSIMSDLEIQIETLKVYRKSLINETAVYGLNRNEATKDSGVDWIGRIPATWNVKKLRYLGSLQNGISKDADSFGSGYPFVSYGNVYNNISIPSQVDGLVESSKADRLTYSVKRGDVFFTRTSETIEEVGFSSTCLSDMEDATFAGFLIRFRPSTDDLLPEYAKYYFRADALRKYFVKEMMIVTRASLGQNLLKNLPVLIPPMDEQKAIAAYLDDMCKDIDAIITQKQCELEALSLHKKSLIFEYVTGKKRVKEVQ